MEMTRKMINECKDVIHWWVATAPAKPEISATDKIKYNKVKIKYTRNLMT